MSRSDRLFALARHLSDGELHRASDLAAALGVSQRTVYRDVEALMASGLPVTGTRGAGYRLADLVPLPPLHLTPDELDVLTLGLAIVAEAQDPDLRGAAQSLVRKVESALPSEAVPLSSAWTQAFARDSSPARGLSHMASIRSAIRNRQKLSVDGPDQEDRRMARTLRPLRLARVGSVWVLTAWCETTQGFAEFRLDRIEAAQALPELFVDEPGRTLADADQAWAG